MNLIVNQINYGLVMEENFTINLCKDGILMYCTHNEGKSVIPERFMKTLKAKIYRKWQLMVANLI